MKLAHEITDADAHVLARKQAVDELRAAERHLDAFEPIIPVRRAREPEPWIEPRPAGGAPLEEDTPGMLASGGGVLLDAASVSWALFGLREMRKPVESPAAASLPRARQRCPLWDIQQNGRANVYLSKLIRILKSVVNISARMNESSTDNQQLVAAAIAHDSDIKIVNWAGECPGGPNVVKNLATHDQTLRDAKAGGIRAMDVLFGSARAALGELRVRYHRVARQRQQFEADGAGGLAALQREHEAFLAQLDRCAQFRIAAIQIDGVSYDATSWYADVRGVTEAARQLAATDEIDRVRDEYAVRSRPVPRRTAFTQSKSSAHFTFDELNTGDYTWAVITDRLLTSLRVVFDPNVAKRAYAVANGVFRSDDDGKTWVRVGPEGATAIRDVAVAVENSNHLFVASSEGVWMSTDLGAAWTLTVRGMVGLTKGDRIHRLLTSRHVTLALGERGLYRLSTPDLGWITRH